MRGGCERRREASPCSCNCTWPRLKVSFRQWCMRRREREGYGRHGGRPWANCERVRRSEEAERGNREVARRRRRARQEDPRGAVERGGACGAERRGVADVEGDALNVRGAQATDRALRRSRARLRGARRQRRRASVEPIAEGQRVKRGMRRRRAAAHEGASRSSSS
jgi:hypothetical protein